MSTGNLHGQIEEHPNLEADDVEALELKLFDNEDEMREAVAQLGNWLTEEVERSEMARLALERAWQESLRMYEGTNRFRRKGQPIENAPNLEITLGAIATDAIYAQILNLIFNVQPIITIRETAEDGLLKEHVKALQRFTNIISTSELNLRGAADNAVLDDVKLGTGVYYIVWQKRVKKTQVETVTKAGPEVKAVPVEDFYVPGGAYEEIENERWVGMRMWLTQHELNIRERDLGWDIEGVQASGVLDRTRQMRERLGRTSGFSQRKAAGTPEGGEVFEIFDIYCLYDIDGDGIDEDLLVTWDRTSKNVLRWRFNPYDKRPFEAMRYQLREFLFYGLGVVEMLAPYQEGASQLYNHWVTNAMLANARFWVGKHGAVPKNQLRIWPNRFLPVSDPRNDIQAITMADTYPSMPQALATTVSFAERRSGINDLTAPRPSAVLGSRTPGITALSMLQKANERFGPAFDAARLATAGAARQGLMRYQERLLAQDLETEQHIIDLMGPDRAQLVIELLRNPEFENAVDVQLTASSASTNRETDRQNSLLILQTMLGYYERVLQLSQVMSTPGVPPMVVETGQKVVSAASELVERTLRTFDQVRDPAEFVIRMDEQLDAALPNLPQAGLQGLATLLDQADQEAAAGGLLPGNPALGPGDTFARRSP